MRFISIVLLSGLFFACSTHQNDLTTDTGTLSEGDRLRAKGFFEEARTQYMRIKTDFPQSANQVVASLRIADSYFEEESFAAAATAYQDFLKTYPGRPEIPEALFKLGLSYANQMPSSAQRDTHTTSEAVDTLTRLMIEYPDNAHKEEANSLIQKGRDQLALKIVEIARFYEKKGQYDSALRRYQELLDQFGDHSMAEEALAHQVVCLRRLGEEAKASDLMKIFEERFPKSEFSSMIKP